MPNLTPWILLAPAAGFVLIGLLGRPLGRAVGPRASERVIGWLASGFVLAAFVLALVNFLALRAAPVPGRSADVTIWSWVASGALRVDFGLLYDPLAAVMLLVVTGVGFLIHVYAIGYMEGDPGYWRFFSFLNFFVFAMTLLVAADNFLFLLFGWAGVGLASYLLIGFWYTRPSAVAAAQKAFVVNVIGDFGLLIAIFLLFGRFGTLNYIPILHGPTLGAGGVALAGGLPLGGPEAVAITLLLFLAAAAKSAQFPLHVWLPDAMEGPTPVSALIHAATMVTAGVYLVARAAPLFDRAPASLAVVAGLGGFTALFAATIACVQYDIKRVLAYSTMSQLGYMFMAEGAGGYTAGIFHLTTHAYFKALLFMAAGAVIHALGGEQDMRRMGGLRRRMPTTFWSFVAGGLALAAIFPFAGFWSKDGVLSAVWQRALRAPGAGAAGWYALYVVGLATAVLTGYYIFRLIFVVFLGAPRAARAREGEPAAVHAGHGTAAGDARSGAAVHEVGPVMAVPMLVLAVLSVVGGFDGLPGHDALGDLLAPVTAPPLGLQAGSFTFYGSLALGLACGLLGIAIAWAVYGARSPALAPRANPLYRFLANRWYVDDLYAVAVVRPIVWVGGMTTRLIEGLTLDGGTRGVAWATGRLSAGLRALQTGYVRTYALGILLGVVAILLYYVVRL